MAGKPGAALIHLDTHVVCWLYNGNVERLSTKARAAIEAGRLAISPMVELELQYLKEIGRFLDRPEVVIGALANDLGLSVSQTSFPLVIARAHTLAWTRDVFDRVITAQAIADEAVLVSKDLRIREHFSRAVW